MPHPTSPSRTYVAMCNKINFDGFYFVKFNIPVGLNQQEISPSWYFCNVVDGTACLEKIITFEDFSNLREEQDDSTWTHHVGSPMAPAPLWYEGWPHDD